MLADEPFAHRPRHFDSNRSGWERIPFPEFVTSQDKSPQIARHIIRWLKHPEQREQCLGQLRHIRTAVAHGGASARAAEYILEALEAKPASPPIPHFPKDSRLTATVPTIFTPLDKSLV